MRIGIDARLYGLEHAGLGRYVLKLVENVLRLDKKNDYVLFLTSAHAAQFRPRKKLKIVTTNVPIYSFSEQIKLPFIFYREKLDLLHVPHFNAPLFYPGRLVLTIHDLIKHDSKGPSTTTRNPGLYTLKRLGYFLLISLISRKASGILVPSEFVKNDLLTRLKVPESKVLVTYEAVSGTIQARSLSPAEKKNTLNRFGLTQPFIVYTGSLYPHKNVDLLVAAIARYNQSHELNLQLAINCSRNVFYERMNLKIKKQGLENTVKMLGFVEDRDISRLYSLALALVHPSLMEGFGLTGLEAMSTGLPVIASRASCLPEVYGQAALYFDPYSVSDLVSVLTLLVGDSALRDKLSRLGLRQVKQYSWKKMAQETITAYKATQV